MPTRLLAAMIALVLADASPESRLNAPPPSFETRQAQAPDESHPAMLAQFLWSSMAENRRKLERGSFIATGRLVIDDPINRARADGDVVISSAFDTGLGAASRSLDSQEISKRAPRISVIRPLVQMDLGQQTDRRITVHGGRTGS